MLTTSLLLAAFLCLGFFARTYSVRVRIAVVVVIIAGIILLMRGG